MSKKTERTVAPGRRKLIKQTASLTVAAVAAQFGFPAILRAQSDTIRIGHITPRTGFLGQVGEYGYKGAMLAVEEANAAGGVLGRKIEMIAEDSVNPATAVTKANKLVERDQVICLIGEISSASGLAIGEQAQRYKIPFFNTGCNSDALRGANCNRYMFHIEGCNTMYTKTIGTWQTAEEPDQGRALGFSNRRLRVRPRSLSRFPRASCSRTAASSSPTISCRPTPPTTAPTFSRSASSSPISSTSISPAWTRPRS